jgi:2-polyprenyl-6-methoxyphenol hydroxylase-like FAD-dependent oxidoreductase
MSWRSPRTVPMTYPRDEAILIVGAGIAGLALGRALHSRGFRAEIVERANGWTLQGAGLYVPGNGVRAVARLGLGDALMDRGVRLSHQRIVDHRGRRLADIDLARVWGHVAPCVGIGRVDLHQILLEGAAAVPVRLATTVSAVIQTPEHVSVQFHDGVTRSYEVVIGADGIRSSIRQLVFGDVRPRGIGQASWRFIAPDTCGVTTWTAMLGRCCTFLMIPIGSRGLYCYADLMTHETVDSVQANETANERFAEYHDHHRDRLRTLFGDFGGPVPRLLGQLDRVDAIHAGPIEEISMDRCVDGRVVLVGDAAHATSPNMAQGASMALEDALVLTDELSARGSPVEALAAFARRRSRRIRWVRQRTHKRDRIRGLPALLRNITLRTAGSAIYEADYRPLFDEP